MQASEPLNQEQMASATRAVNIGVRQRHLQLRQLNGCWVDFIDYSLDDLLLLSVDT